MNRLLIIGLVLLIGGILVGEVSYNFLGNIPLTVAGLICMIVGAMSVQIPTFATKKRQLRALVEGGYTGVEKLLAEKNIVTQGIYMPPNEGASLVFVSTGDAEEAAADVKSFKGAVQADMEGRGVVIPAPGSIVVNSVLQNKSSSVNELLVSVLVKNLGGVASITAEVKGGNVKVTLDKPWRIKNHPKCEAFLGSVSVSVAGSALAAWFKSPIVYLGEKTSGSVTIAHFKVMRLRPGRV